MTTTYPTTPDALSNPNPGDPLSSAVVPHAQQHTNVNDAIEAIQAKLGSGATGQSPAASTVLAGTGPGQSGYRQITEADLAPITAIPYNRLALANSIVTGDIKDGTIQGIDIAPDTVTAANIAPGAVTGSELAPNAVSSGHIGPNQIQTGHIAPDQITSALIAPGTIAASDIGPGQIGRSHLGSDLITSAYVENRSLTGSDLALGTVGTPELASKATSDASGNSSSAAFSATNNAGWVYDQASLAVAVTIPAGASGWVLASFVGAFQSDVLGTHVHFGLVRVGVHSAPPWMSIVRFGAANSPQLITAQLAENLGPGTYQYAIAVQALTADFTWSFVLNGSRSLMVQALYR